MPQFHENRFGQLLKALEDGWEIEEPIILGALWGRTATVNKPGVYHFVLRKQRQEQTTLMSLPLSPQLLMFLSENNMQINSR